jgi:hypothetical protein
MSGVVSVRARILYALDTVDELCVGALRTAGLVVNRRAGRVIYYRLADNFPAPLREHCLRRLVELTRTHDGDELLTDEEVDQ